MLTSLKEILNSSNALENQYGSDYKMKWDTWLDSFWYDNYSAYVRDVNSFWRAFKLGNESNVSFYDLNW